MRFRVCIIGAGNISNTRHIPGLKQLGRSDIVGVIGVSEKNVKRTATTHKIPNQYVLTKSDSYIEQIKMLPWFEDVDAVVIGVPPHEHYDIAKACLMLKKHVLLEKPMVMNVEQADELIYISEQHGRVFNLMHNFQYASNFLKLEKRLKSGEFGEIVSFFEMQYTNRDRRLPEWYNELPLGLFYDEAAHFIYLLERLGGDVKVLNAHAQFGEIKEATPMLLTATLQAGKYPVSMFINFNSPICEWTLIISCEKKLVIYDFFRDIVVAIPNDQQHLAKNVITTSWSFTIQNWLGTVINGLKMLRGKLLYGHDVVLNHFLNNIESGNSIPDISAQLGRKNVITMNEIVEKALED